MDGRAAHIFLNRMQMQVEDKLINLSPGMAVTVSYLFSALLRCKQESLRER
jgi:hemolysin D